eukprot:12311938-Karenia_brevis.AAC.1
MGKRGYNSMPRHGRQPDAEHGEHGQSSNAIDNSDNQLESCLTRTSFIGTQPSDLPLQKKLEPGMSQPRHCCGYNGQPCMFSNARPGQEARASK